MVKIWSVKRKCQIEAKATNGYTTHIRDPTVVCSVKEAWLSLGHLPVGGMAKY